MGFGHVLRCLALAQAWQDAGGEVAFACADLPEMLSERLKAENCRVLALQAEIGSQNDALQTQETARNLSASWVICDGYKFDGDFLQALNGESFSLLVLDDFSARNLSAADVILNPNAGADQSLYAHFAANSQILAGQQFALLRREFRLQAQGEKAILEKIERVLVAMGGTDPNNLAPRALDWLQSQDFCGEAVVLSGAREFNVSDFGFDLKIVRAQNEVPDWMRWCDVALAAAGSTTWELACCGVPTILSIVADNQRELARWSDENGVGLSVGEPDEKWEERLESACKTLENFSARRAMSQQASQTIDGQGAARVMQKMWSEALQLRPATLQDAELLLCWRNDEQTRAMSLDGNLVVWKTHLEWLQTCLSDPNHAIWIAHKNRASIGTVRFAREQQFATISIVLAPDWRGRGIGKTLIRRACQAIFGMWNINKIRAIIKAANAASCRSFEKAGFCCETEKLSMSQLIFVLERPT